jgi:NADH dehydrogenase
MKSDHYLSLNVPSTNKRRVVIIGGGFGGINTAKRLRGKNFQIVLFDSHNYHTLQPLLYQVATAGLQPDSIASPLRNIFKGHDDFYFRLFKITAIDPDKNMVYTSGGELSYDYLVIAGGSRPNFFGNKKTEEYAIPLKSIPDALNLRSQFMQVLEQAEMAYDQKEKNALLNIVLVGGGPTGVETAGALAELKNCVLPKDYPALDFKLMNIYLVQSGERLLPQMSEKAGARAQHDLEKLGVLILLNTRVESYDGQSIQFNNQEPINTATVIWAAGVKSSTFPGLKSEWLDHGRILVDEHCQVPGTNIFAIGDIALMKTGAYPQGHPGVAQVAIQMGAYVGNNLRNLIDNKTVKPFKYFDKGTLATIGRGKAVADLPGNIHFGGRLAWWIWLFVHINYLISFRNKLLVFASWIWNYFTYDKGNRLIIRAYVRKDGMANVEGLGANEPENAAVLH